MTSVPAPLAIRRDGSTVRLTLNRPDTANTVNLAMARAFRTAIADLDETVKVVVLDANGSVFCGGGDVTEMAAMEDLPTYLHDVTDAFHCALVDLARHNAIVIAAVDGAAAGAGLGLALSADIIVATDRARFLTAYERVGLTPDSGVSYWLPRIVGPRRAMSMSALGRTLDSATAMEWGIVTEVVPHGELHERVNTLTASITRGPAEPLVETRRLYRAAAAGDYAQHLEDEARTICAAARRPETARLIHDFTARDRTPK